MTPRPALGTLALRTALDPDLDARFSSWCDDHHLEQLAVPGFQRVRRGRRTDTTAADTWRFLTIYDLDDAAVLASDAYAEYRARPGGLPDDLTGRLRVERREGDEVRRFAEGRVAEPTPGLVAGGAAVLHLALEADDPRASAVDEVARVASTVPGVTLVRRIDVPGDGPVLVAEVDGDGDGLDLADGSPLAGWHRYVLEYTATP